MANKVKRKQTPSLTSSPVSYRLGNGLIAQIATVAEQIGVTRNRLVSLVLAEYLTERHAEKLARLAAEVPKDAGIDLFS